jgi:hypothetical protein
MLSQISCVPRIDRLYDHGKNKKISASVEIFWQIFISSFHIILLPFSFFT